MNGSGSAQKTELDVSWTRISDEGAKVIADALTRPEANIVLLNLGVTRLGSKQVKCIIASLKNNATLTSLDLGGNSIDVEALKPIVRLLKRVAYYFLPSNIHFDCKAKFNKGDLVYWMDF